ncbi:lipocalin-like domain-containing protein [Niastella vici]|nr:lipocalin family protein [Niastella vici]
MLRSFTKTLALVLFATATFTACKKNHDDDSLAITKENLVATYTLSSMKMKGTNYPEADVTSQFYDACERDDQTVLKSDGTMSYVDAGTKCSSAGDYTSTWSISGSKITIDGDEYTVKSLTKGQLVYEVSSTYSGQTVTVTYTYSRK